MAYTKPFNTKPPEPGLSIAWFTNSEVMSVVTNHFQTHGFSNFPAWTSPFSSTKPTGLSQNSASSHELHRASDSHIEMFALHDQPIAGG